MRGHGAAHRAAHQRRAAPGERTVVGQRLGKAHRDAGADGRRKADQESRPGIVRGEGGGEQRRQRRDRAVHEAGEPRLDILQHEHAPRGLVLGGARAAARSFAEFVGELLVLVLGRGEAREQLAHGVVVRGLGGAPVKPRRFVFHLFGKFAHRVEPERAG